MVNTRSGGDSPFLLQRTHQMLINLRAGVFPVRWMPDAAYGLGYPFFSYYAALPYYLAGLFALAGLDLLIALKLVQTLGFVAAALAMYGWMHGMTRSRWAAWLAAVAYTVAPFHLVNVYVRGDSLSEFYAFAFYPLLLWALDGIGKGASQQVGKSASRQVVALALAYAGLILTHNISALIFTPFALLYIAIRFLAREMDRRSLLIAHCSLLIGVLLATWYWLPALAELRNVQLGPSTQDYFHYSRHFRTLNLVQGKPLFDYSIAADHRSCSPFTMGLVQAVFAALGGLALTVQMLRRRLEPRWGFVLLGLLVSTAMITPLSKPLWDHLPLLPIVQFPWRFLSVQALFAAAATGQIADCRLVLSAVEGLQIINRKSQVGESVRRRVGKSASLKSEIRNPKLFIGHWSLVIPIAVLLTISTLLPLHPDRLPIGPADVTVERLQLYELFTANIGTTIRYEWLPKTAVPRPFTSDALVEPDAPPRAILLEGTSLEATLLERGPTRQTWWVRGKGGGIAFPLLYWPGWKARVDGEPVEAWPVEGSGYLALEVPPGEHTVLLRLGRTPVRAVAEAASLAALLGLAVGFAVRGVRVQRSRGAGEQRSRRAGERTVQENTHRSPLATCILATCILATCFGLALLLSRTISSAGESDLTMDFEQMPYLHHNPDGVDFGGVARLAGYTLSTDELSPGNTLTVTLDWTGVEEGTYTTTLSLVSPAAVRHDVEPITEAAVPLSPCLLVPLSLPQDIPRGVYLLQLRLFGPEGELRARTPGGQGRGTLYLRPVRVPRGPSLPPHVSVLAPFGPDIRLHAATVAQPAPDRLAVWLAWSAVRPMAANYAISLRLLDGDGQLRSQMDTQPGYGFLPTSLWRPGEWITDKYLFALPDDLPPADGYHLEVLLYQVSTLEPVGKARLGGFALPLETPFEVRHAPRTFALPHLQHPLGVEFGGEVRLAGYNLVQGEDALQLTLWWEALQAPQADYTVFVHLFDSATEEILAQSDAQPRGGAYPTSWWAAGEVVSETVRLPLGSVPQGTYRLAVGLYDRALTRLVAVGPDGQRLPDDRMTLPVEVKIRPRE